jgi:type IV pilus assembly protein PilW
MSARHWLVRAAGLALIEILVALVLGLVVVGAVLASYLSSGRSGLLQSAVAQMDEDAQIGLRILSRDLQLAGYASPVSMDAASLVFTKTYNDRAVFGCDKGFTAALASTPSVCAGSGGTPSIEIAFEADLHNSVVSAGKPTDCLGNALPSGPQGITYHRYAVGSSTPGRSELRCSSGSTTAPLVDNVERVQFWYGEADSDGQRQVQVYASAANVDFTRVLSVRVCLLMRSAEAVISAEDAALKSYLDCDGASQTSTDGRLRRAYFNTTALRSKMPL